MARTLNIDIVDRSVAPLNPVNIAIINQPNPVKGYTATENEVAKLIQIPNYFITDENGEQVSGLNYYKYFPKSGGGGSAVLIDKMITENGEYAAVDDNADGYSNVDVSVPIPQPVLIEKTVDANGTYVAVDDEADGYSTVVVDVPSGGGGSVDNLVTLSDYDGTVIAQYTPQQFAQLESYPTPPSHEYLTFNEYNWTLSNAKTYVAKYGSLNIGATYNTSDGKTRMFVTVDGGRLKIGLRLGVNGTVDIEWGDGSAHNTMSGSDVSTTQLTSHAYSTAGDYIIALTVSGSVSIFEGFLCEPTGVNDNRKYAYRSILNSIFIGNEFGIGSSAFSNCYDLTSITIPDTVTSIEGYAFNNCYALTSITIPTGVTSIKSYAFNSCSALTSITIPDTVTSIGDNTFYSCSALTSITIPTGVTSIGDNTFYSCYDLTSITIPDTVTSIGYGAFNSCTALTSITIPDTVTSIGNNAFNSCRSLTSITIPDTVTSIEGYAFNNCYALTSITIPTGVKSIGSYAFYSCYALTSITIPTGVTSIGSRAFTNCSALTSITIPDTVTSIGIYAFSYCYALTSITIPDTVTSIGNYVFTNCSALTSITIPDTVTSIGNNAFSNCYGLGYIRFESEKPPTVANSGAFYNVPSDCIIYVPSASLSAYKSKTNYPSSTKYTYIGY